MSSWLCCVRSEAGVPRVSATLLRSRSAEAVQGFPLLNKKLAIAMGDFFQGCHCVLLLLFCYLPLRHLHRCYTGSYMRKRQQKPFISASHRHRGSWCVASCASARDPGRPQEGGKGLPWPTLDTPLMPKNQIKYSMPSYCVRHTYTKK